MRGVKKRWWHTKEEVHAFFRRVGWHHLGGRISNKRDGVNGMVAREIALLVGGEKKTERNRSSW